MIGVDYEYTPITGWIKDSVSGWRRQAPEAVSQHDNVVVWKKRSTVKKIEGRVCGAAGGGQRDDGVSD
jgi:hypothetical protein